METKKLVKESFFREINFISLQTESTRFGQFGYIEKSYYFVRHARMCTFGAKVITPS